MEFQPTIEIKRKHVYLFAAVAVFLFAGLFLASAQADIGIPDAVREKLGNENPAAWSNSGGSGGDSGSSSAPARTHDSIEIKTVLDGNVITVQEAISNLDNEVRSLEDKAEKAMKSKSCTVEIQQCKRLYERIEYTGPGYLGGSLGTNEKTNCASKETISDDSGEVKLSSASAPSTELSSGDYWQCNRGRATCKHKTSTEAFTKVSLNC